MFKDAAFEVRSSAVDKRGRKVKSGKKNEDMRRYYRIRNEEEGEHAAQEQQQQVAGEDEDGHNQQAAAAGAPQQPRGDDQRRGAGSAGRKSKRQQAAPQADGSGSQAESDSEPAGNGLGDEERAAQERWARMRCGQRGGRRGEGGACRCGRLHCKPAAAPQLLRCMASLRCTPSIAINKPARWPGPAQAAPFYGQGVTICCVEQCPSPTSCEGVPHVWLAATLNPWAAGPVLWANIPLNHLPTFHHMQSPMHPHVPPFWRTSPLCVPASGLPSPTVPACQCRGLAGPETSDEEEDEEEGEGSSSAEESEEQEEDFRVRPRLTGGPDEEGEEDEVQVAVTEADLQEWGVGALAANPEEEVRAVGRRQQGLPPTACHRPARPILPCCVHLSATHRLCCK